MKLTASSAESVRHFWTAVETLLDAQRWSDAAVTVRAFARQVKQPGLRVTLGTLFYERGQRAAAVQEWTAALELAQTAGDWPVAAAVHHNLAAMYRDLGDDRLARCFQQRATSLQTDCGPEELLQLGNDALAADRTELAMSLYQAAAELVAENDPLLADLLATRGVLSGLNGEPRAGLRWLQQAYREHFAAGDHHHAGKDLRNAAALFEQMGRLGWATFCLNLAREHFRAAGDSAGVQTVAVSLRRLSALRCIADIKPEWN